MYLEKLVPSHEVEDQSHAFDRPHDSTAVGQPGSVQHELQAGFELPSSVWTAMLACYAVFFMAIFAATGGSGPAIFAIVISILYTVMYFGMAKILSSIGGAERPSPLDRGEGLQTWTGLMSRNAVIGQVLVVPACVALFGISIAVICAIVLP